MTMQSLAVVLMVVLGLVGSAGCAGAGGRAEDPLQAPRAEDVRGAVR